MEYLDMLKTYTLFENTLFDYTVALGIVIGAIIAFKIFEKIVLVRIKNISKKTTNTVDDVLVDAIQQMGLLFYIAIGLYVGAQHLVLSERIDMSIRLFVLVIVTYEIIRALQTIVRFVLKRHATKEGENASSESMVHLGMLFARIILWSVGGLFVMSNLGINITALAASLGIGSLAIALALQNILSDMFSSFSIYADKPFEIGDYIVIGADSGTVKKIGLKTTRITTLQGEELVVSNKELTTVRVQNYKKMKRRRVAFTFGVVYDTPKKKLEMIPTKVKEIIEGVDHLEFDRCHFHEFGDSALLFDVVYYVDTREYLPYIDTRQDINLKLFEVFEKEKIEFAYPTQTVVVKK